MNNNKRQKNVALFILLLLLFCYPIFSIFNINYTFYNIPVLYVYIGIVWLLAIISLFISAELKPIRKSRKPNE